MREAAHDCWLPRPTQQSNVCSCVQVWGQEQEHCRSSRRGGGIMRQRVWAGGGASSSETTDTSHSTPTPTVHSSPRPLPAPPTHSLAQPHCTHTHCRPPCSLSPSTPTALPTPLAHTHCRPPRSPSPSTPTHSHNHHTARSPPPRMIIPVLRGAALMAVSLMRRMSSTKSRRSPGHL